MKSILRACVATAASGAAMLVTVSALAFPFGNHHNWHPGSGHTGTVPVPEVDGNGATVAAAIVLGGAAVILSRRKRHGN